MGTMIARQQTPDVTDAADGGTSRNNASVVGKLIRYMKQVAVSQTHSLKYQNKTHPLKYQNKTIVFKSSK